MSGWRIPDITPLIYVAIFGLICAALLLLGGTGYLIWFIINHVRIV